MRFRAPLYHRRTRLGCHDCAKIFAQFTRHFAFAGTNIQIRARVEDGVIVIIITLTTFIAASMTMH